jgi:hypothetical protein
VLPTNGLTGRLKDLLGRLKVLFKNRVLLSSRAYEITKIINHSV